MKSLPFCTGEKEDVSQSQGRCCQKNVCRSTCAEMEMRGLQEDLEESEGLHTSRAAHRHSYRGPAAGLSLPHTASWDESVSLTGNSFPGKDL